MENISNVVFFIINWCAEHLTYPMQSVKVITKYNKFIIIYWYNRPIYIIQSIYYN